MQSVLVRRLAIGIKLLAYQRIFHGGLQGVHHQRMGGLALKSGDFGNGSFQSVGELERSGGDHDVLQ
jgi:hypothetical protein